MTDSKSDSGQHRAKRRRFLPLVWISGVAAAALLGLGVSGTLSSWTSAIINNSSNTAAVNSAVILQETGAGAITCNSTDGAQATVNVATCATIDKYGGIASPLSPGGTQSATVTMKNTGTESGALTLAASGCTPSGGTAPTPNLCSELQVKVECPTGTAKVATSTLAAFATTTATTPASIATLAAGASVDCVFTVSLPANASPTYAGQSVSQPLTWTLTGA